MTAGLINKKQAIKPEKSACNPTISMIWHALNEFLAHYATGDTRENMFKTPKQNRSYFYFNQNLDLFLFIFSTFSNERCIL